MKLFAIGFPKSGTTTLTVALRASGLRVAHWQMDNGKFVGRAIYRGLLGTGDPLAELAGYDAVTQADVCLPGRGINCWPNLDFAVLRAIRAADPSCLLLLNTREPSKIADSMIRWRDLQARLVRADIPGLPRGFGTTREQLERWITNHFDACRALVRDDPRFLELNIESADAPMKLGEALGITIEGWGIHKPSPRLASAVEGQEHNRR